MSKEKILGNVAGSFLGEGKSVAGEPCLEVEVQTDDQTTWRVKIPLIIDGDKMEDAFEDAVKLANKVVGNIKYAAMYPGPGQQGYGPPQQQYQYPQGFQQPAAPAPAPVQQPAQMAPNQLTQEQFQTLLAQLGTPQGQQAAQ